MVKSWYKYRKYFSGSLFKNYYCFILSSDAQWIHSIDLFFPQFGKKFYSIIVAVAK